MNRFTTAWLPALIACSFFGCGSDLKHANIPLEIELRATSMMGGKDCIHDSVSSCILAPGDLNNDSISDVIVGYKRHGIHCEIAAYSGSNGEPIWLISEDDIEGRIDSLALINDVNSNHWSYATRDGFMVKTLPS